MNDSILTSIKKMLGLTEEYEHFDPDITMHINAVLMTLTQIGVGPSDGFRITDKTQLWSDFIDETRSNILGSIQSYIHHKVKLMFDPPQNSFTIESMNRIINELEWRLNVAVDNTSPNIDEPLE